MLTWRPLAAAQTFTGPNSVNLEANSRDHRRVFVQGRLAPGRTLTQANTEITALGRQFDAALQEERGAPQTGVIAASQIRTSWNAHPASRIMGVPDQILKPLVAALATAVGLVLLVACTNLTNLMLARHGRRRAELAVRAAIGASRARLVRQVSMEAVILAAAGGLAGLGVARALMVVLSTEVPLSSVALQVLPRVDLAALVAASLATPARAMCRRTVARGPGHAFRSALGIGQRHRGILAALARPDHLALAHVNFKQQQSDEVRAARIAEAALQQVAARPDVEAVGLSAGFPLGLNGVSAGSAFSSEQPRGATAQLVAGTPGMMTTLGVRVVRGRGISDRDTRESQPVAVLTKSTADRLFGETDPIGQLRSSSRSPASTVCCRTSSLTARGNSACAWRSVRMPPTSAGWSSSKD